jgi:hypothetical protein
MNHPLTPSALDIARVREETSHQYTSFKLTPPTKTVYIPHGQRASMGEVTGKGYIANLWITFPGWFWQHWNTKAPVSQTILKTLIIRIYWDGAEKPAVEAPVGDFFGIGLCEVANFHSKYFGMSSGGFFCKFPMPFRKGFRIEFDNTDETIDTDIFMNAVYQLDDTLPEDCAYFHTQFHTGRCEGTDTFAIADLRGRGHYAGCALSMQAESELNYLSFLEAPEYMYVDEDWETPRVTGTGLEDYFMGGWYFREGCFHGALHGVPVKDVLKSLIAMYRVHEADAIRFRERFKMMFVNHFDPTRLLPFLYSSVIYAYLDTPEGQNPPLPPREKLLIWNRVRDCDHQSIP